METIKSIKEVLGKSLCADDKIYESYQQKLSDNLPTRDENLQSHFCTYFLPFNPKNREVFFIHHKKSGIWLSPGGHIDKGESTFEALNREIGEELGINNFFKEEPEPFLFTITPIENPKHPCKTHYDIWYLVLTDGKNFKLDTEEFLDSKWLSIKDARKIVIDPSNLLALDALEKIK